MSGKAAWLTGFVAGPATVGGMTIEPPGSRAIATTNRNSNLVLALLHRLPPGKFGHVFVDGLRAFGIPMLFGIEPAVYLIAKAAPDLRFVGTQHNDNPLMSGPIGEAERERRIHQYLRSIGYLKD